MKIFQFAALYNPNADERKKGEKAAIIVPITDCLAADEKAAMLIAARAIPDEFIEKLERVEVAVRPF